MPVYVNDVDTLKDFFTREIKQKKYYIEPLVLSEWIYGYVGNDFINRHHPEVLSLLKEAEKITPDLDRADVLTEFVVVVNKIHADHYLDDMKAWSEYYSKMTKRTPVAELSLKYLQEQ